MSKAAELAALIGSQTALSNRNLVINGAMTVAQRGTSHTQSPNSGNYHTVDRFSYRRTGTWSGVTAVALSQESSGAPSGFTHFLRYAPTGSDSSTPSDTAMYIDAKLEGNSVSSLALGTSAAKSFTVSFYVRSSVTGTFSVGFQNNDSTKHSYVAEYTINSANTWEQKEITVDAPTSGTFETDTSTGLAFYFIVSADASSSTYSTSTIGSWLSATDARWSTNQSDGVTTAANQTFDITGIQLEVGEQATPFEHRSYGDELRRCQRYFAKIRANWSGDTTNDGSYRASYQNAVEMRATPTATWTNISQAGFDAAHNSEQITTYGGGVYRQCNTTSDGRLYWSDATLDAEL